MSEDIVAPEREICDPHHHLWERPNNRYLLDELLADTGSGHNVVSTVFVECNSMYRADGEEEMRPVGETEFVDGVAAKSASRGRDEVCAGIVSHADLELGAAVGEVLDAHRAVSDRFRGIRHSVGWDPSPEVRNSRTATGQGLLLDKTFREGFRELGKRDLSFDAWLYHRQIPELTDLAKAFPETTIILDHFGGPLGYGPYAGKHEEIFQAWRRDISDTAQCENVFVKLGGLVMPINGYGFHERRLPATSDEIVAATGRYHRHAIEVFGADRCMFESNFPVDKLSCSYHVLWNAFKKIAADASESEKDKLFRDTAVRAYKL